MPNALILEIIEALGALAPQVPEVISLVESATTIAQTGAVSAEMETAIRARLDAVKALIDAA